MTKLKFKSNIFKSIFYNFFYKFLLQFFFMYIETSKNPSTKYCQENKERLERKARERSHSFLKKSKKKKWQYSGKPNKNLPENGKQKVVEYRKKILARKNAFQFRKFWFFIRKV